jgi:hypothetical protein
VRTLVRQLCSKGIYDIGTVCPKELVPFFVSCCFTDDPEQSTFMAYAGADLVLLQQAQMQAEVRIHLHTCNSLLSSEGGNLQNSTLKPESNGPWMVCAPAGVFGGGAAATARRPALLLLGSA